MIYMTILIANVLNEWCQIQMAFNNSNHDSMMVGWIWSKSQQPNLWMKTKNYKKKIVSITSDSQSDLLFLKKKNIRTPYSWDEE